MFKGIIMSDLKFILHIMADLYIKIYHGKTDCGIGWRDIGMRSEIGNLEIQYKIIPLSRMFNISNKKKDDILSLKINQMILPWD